MADVPSGQLALVHLDAHPIPVFSGTATGGGAGNLTVGGSQIGWIYKDEIFIVDYDPPGYSVTLRRIRFRNSAGNYAVGWIDPSYKPGTYGDWGGKQGYFHKYKVEGNATLVENTKRLVAGEPGHATDGPYLVFDVVKPTNIYRVTDGSLIRDLPIGSMVCLNGSGVWQKHIAVVPHIGVKGYHLSGVSDEWNLTPKSTGPKYWVQLNFTAPNGGSLPSVRNLK